MQHNVDLIGCSHLTYVVSHRVPMTRTGQVHQYPYGRQTLGPAVFAREVSFDCSSSTLHRHFWHARKLREMLDARLVLLTRGAAQRGSDRGGGDRGVVVVLSRAGCVGCDASRGVRRQADIFEAVRRAVRPRDVHDHRDDASCRHSCVFTPPSGLRRRRPRFETVLFSGGGSFLEQV